MLNFINVKQHKTNLEKTFLHKKTANSIEFYTMESALAGKEILGNFGKNNEDLLMYKQVFLPNNHNDCLLLSLSFTDRKDDALAERKKEFFQKYFLFDKNHFDIM